LNIVNEMSVTKSLASILTPPLNPVDSPTESDWRSVEGKLGFTLPQDYKDFVDIYGAGSVDGFLWVLNPISKNPNLNLFDQAKSRLDAQRRFSKDIRGITPYPLHPESNGLFPWGVTDNGDVLYWLCEGPASAWRVVICDSRCSRWQILNAGFGEILMGIVIKELRIECFPGDFPSQLPDFVAV
ncbi:MAG: SMI1/KNR4 family protein, partial [Planctomycetaceae bacterium]|nr:SMI1/KNR4 family protein [Planctomycetaceae bacterium]